MKTPISKLAFLLSAAAIAVSSQSARAVVETDLNDGTSSTTYDGITMTPNLLTGLTPAGVYTVSAGTNPKTGNPIVAGDTITGADNSFPLTGFNDGNANDAVQSPETVLLSNGQLGSSLLGVPQFTFSLNTSVNSAGYDLSDVISINGFAGYSQQLANQAYTVSFSTVSAPTVFTNLATVSYTPFTNVGAAASSFIDLTDLAQATGVGAVRFTYTDAPGQTGVQDGQLIREIEVLGTPSVATPEPSTYAMILGGMAVLGFLVRRKTIQAR